MPQWSLISIIEPSRFDPAAAYVAATRYKLDDYRPYLYVTKDFGKTWKKITNGIPDNDFTRVIREDPNRQGILYAGTETGVYFSVDEGKNWQSLRLNFPVTPVHDMVVHENDLVVGTHGRSFLILDDLTLLYQAIKMKPNLPLFLFKPAKTNLFFGRYDKKPVNEGESLPVGVCVNYYLKEKPGEKEVSLTFLDAGGNMVRTFSQKPIRKKEPAVAAKPGMNRFVWDFHYTPAHEVKGAVFWGPGNAAPFAVPGTYSVRLTVGEKTVEQTFEVIKDPNYAITAQEFKQQFDLLAKIRDKLSQTHDAVNEIRNIRKQVQWVTGHTKKEPYYKKIEKAAAALEKKLKPLEDELIQHKAKAQQDLLHYPIKLNNKLSSLGSWVVVNSLGAPTKQALDLFAHLSQQVDVQLDRLKQVIEKDAAAFNRLVQELAVPAIIPEHFKK